MVALPSGERVPALGQGTWNMGDDPRVRAEEIAALRLGIERGLTLIDTAEMYGDGRSETLEAFTELRTAGKIRYFGVSNLDLADMKEFRATAGGAAVATNQLLYNLSRRGIEWGRLLRHKGLGAFSARHGMAPAQVALAWALAQENLIAIPRSANRARVLENAGAVDRTLSVAQGTELAALFRPPHGPSPLEML